MTENHQDEIECPCESCVASRAFDRDTLQKLQPDKAAALLMHMLAHKLLACVNKDNPIDKVLVYSMHHISTLMGIQTAVMFEPNKVDPTEGSVH